MTQVTAVRTVWILGGLLGICLAVVAWSIWLVVKRYREGRDRVENMRKEVRQMTLDMVSSKTETAEAAPNAEETQ